MNKKLPLRAKLILFLAATIAVSITLFIAMASFELRAIRNGKETLARTLAESYIDKIDRNLFERYGDVQAFALSEPARSINSDRITAFMNDMMGAYTPIYDALIVADLSGKVIAINGVDKTGKETSLRSLIGKNYSDSFWFKEAVSGRITPGTALVEDVQLDQDLTKVFGKPTYVMNFTAPIRDKTSGDIIGVWSNRMSWSDVVQAITNEELQKVRTDKQKDIFAFLVDSKGTFIVHPEGLEREYKSKLPDFDARSTNAKTATEITQIDLDAPYFKGNTYEALTSSKGYSIYPGKGWIAGIQVSSDEESLRFTWALIVGAAIVFAGLLMAGWMTVGKISTSLQHVVSGLTSESASMTSAADQISRGSKNLAHASTVQASAIQQTASAVEEMSAMVKKSADNAVKSRQVSTASRDAASRGQQTVKEMMHAISDINSSNENIMKQIENSNRQISEIVKVITEIGNKTKVINEIVFQTKLLSFNASVEAARAGEHGKGFAVVAEEVGNLAQMSGNAAKEIADMLNGSIQRVESIVSDTKAQVERLVADGKDKVQTGTVVAKQCSEILEDVVRNVTEVNDMISEISTAAQEQALGVSEITKAMNQLDQSTHENANTSRESANASDQLSAQAQQLLTVVADLETVIDGRSRLPAISHQAIPSASLPQADAARTKKYSGRSEHKVELKPLGDDRQGASRPPGRPTFESPDSKIAALKNRKWKA